MFLMKCYAALSAGPTCVHFVCLSHHRLVCVFRLVQDSQKRQRCAGCVCACVWVCVFSSETDAETEGGCSSILMSAYSCYCSLFCSVRDVSPWCVFFSAFYFSASFLFYLLVLRSDCAAANQSTTLFPSITPCDPFGTLPWALNASFGLHNSHIHTSCTHWGV